MRKLYLLIIVALLSYQAGAQSPIRLTDTLFFVNTALGDTISLQDSIYKATGPNYIWGIHFAANFKNPGAGIDSTIALGDSLVFSQGNPLDSGGTPQTGVGFRIHLPNPPTGGLFVSGPTGVVIWPLYDQASGLHAGPYDSIKVVVTIIPTGIETAPLSKMYITQQKASLNIRFGDIGNLVQQVSLYDVSGRLVFSGSAQQSQSIPTGGWSEGVYFCQITTYSGERRTIKFVLQQ